MSTRSASAGDFEVDSWVHVLGGFVSRHQPLWIKIGNLESRMLADTLADVAIREPIYVAGLARSGSTVLLEILEQHPDTATHRYRDYPLLFTPYLWNRFLERVPQQNAPPVERSHGDGILITPESPEAFEEVLWMAFFPHLHDPSTSAVLDGSVRNDAFGAFYRDHIRKLLMVRGARRYLSKGNYNVTRLEYLLELFPDARFVIPVRDPFWQVASLIKQHRLFCERTRNNPRARLHLQRVGHFEFGLDRRPIHAGDDENIRGILQCFATGAEVEGWARYWSHIYGYVADRLDSSTRLRQASIVVRHEDLCTDARQTLRRVLDHCRLSQIATLIDGAARRLHFPTYYRPPFTPEERELIEHHTRAVESRLAEHAGEPAGEFGRRDSSAVTTSAPPAASALRAAE